MNINSESKLNKTEPANSELGGVSKRFYLTKDRQGNYQILNELAYEKKLIYG